MYEAKGEEVSTERFKRALANTTRALSGHTELSITYGDVAEVGQKNELVLPQLSNALDDKKMALARGRGNRLAFLERFGGAAYVRALQKHGQPLAAQIINLMECARTDVLGKQAYAGAVKPLAALDKADAQQYQYVTESSLGKAYAMSLALREQVGEVLTAQQNAVKENAFADLESELKTWVDDAPKRISDEKEQWRAYVELLKLLGVELPPDFVEQVLPEESQGEMVDEAADEEYVAEASTSTDDVEQEGELTSATGEEGAGADEAQMDAGATGEQAGPPPKTFGDTNVEYAVYTTEFDQIASAQKLVSQGEWSALQDKFLMLTRSNRGLARRLAMQLKHCLMAQHSLGWEADQEEGFVDSTRLAPFVAGGDERIYKQLVVKKKLDTAVTLLVDNSGSMRGRPIDMAAVCTDTLATTLEQCGVVTEVLGFTTAAWKGGQARKQWLEGGRPENPGRLNELLFTIFKPFNKA